VNIGNGAQAWSTLLSQITIDGCPVVANGVVYVSNSVQTYAVDATSGAVLWVGDGGVDTAQNPVVVNGRLYVASANGGLIACAPRAPTSASAAIDERPDLSRLVPDRTLKFDGSAESH
jgi:glucose dehydrogenase